MQTSTLTVQDIVRRPIFQGAVIFANDKALERIVKWVHVMEVTEVGHLLSGQELILCTGIGWQDDEEKSASFLQQLIRCEAAGLCVELGTYTKKPLERMKRMAMDADFPLIFFYHEVRYIDITRELHTHLINAQYQMNAELSQFGQRLDSLALSGKGMAALLGELQRTVRAQVVYRRSDDVGAQPYCAPPVPGRTRAAALAARAFDGQHDTAAQADVRTDQVICRTIAVMDRQFAQLALLADADRPLGAFEQQALERCASAVAHELLRTLYNEEKRKLSEHQWVGAWLKGTIGARDLAEQAALLPGYRPDCVKTVIVIEPQSAAADLPDFESSALQRQLMARRLFDKHGYTLLPEWREGRIVYVVLARRQTPDSADDARRLMDELRALDAASPAPLYGPLYAVGPSFTAPESLPASYEAALRSLDIRHASGVVDSPLYRDLHIYRMVHQLQRNPVFQTFCRDYVTPVLDHDREHGGQLYATLRTLLELSGAKNETAKALFVVRQTLYHRIDKLKELLGEDFLLPPKRSAIELAVHAHEYASRPPLGGAQ
ncbi:PucR family transcriptional regulator ligand-binding domain-containing protein [Paenibacillus sp. IB182496]|uniref:PucR family transcriptional regulator ligand-binding domain-containing protein n=1 Tax=Paenibacillus sabuli TaxID=2772509 RepID=A0A927BWL5_9BACL|nr:PucR family transcriptional regulator [Paenibacillus sabuli]MBD2846844.1 PucR family transcriptional regulator ligand-binding domain-containing protein [Paenibacillus sabuli]